MEVLITAEGREHFKILKTCLIQKNWNNSILFMRSPMHVEVLLICGGKGTFHIVLIVIKH